MDATGTEAGVDKVREGLRLFNEEFFFEAHEVLEEMWHLERGEARQFLQGLIQLSAAYHHFQNGNLAGAAALLQRGADKMRTYPSRYLGFDAEALVRSADRDRERILRMNLGQAPAGPIDFPKIALAPT